VPAAQKLNLLRDAEGVADLDAEIADGTFKLRMFKEELYGSKVASFSRKSELALFRLERDTGEFSPLNALLRRGRHCIEFALSLLDATGADMALYCNAHMVRTVARTCRV
jgi:hypothetical protein